MSDTPYRLIRPTRVYEALVPWPGEPYPYCLGKGILLASGSFVWRKIVSHRFPRRSLCRCSVQGRDYWAWMEESVQYAEVAS